MRSGQHGHADKSKVTSHLSWRRRFRNTAAIVLVGLCAITASGCDRLDSFTGDHSMRWVGKTLLPKEQVQVPQYRATALLPNLTAPEVAQAIGETPGPDSTAKRATGKGWSVTVKQSQFATTVRFTHTCRTLVQDKQRALAVARDLFADLGADPATWAWFTITDATGAVRAIAEPKVEDRQTWATGSFAVLVDEHGVCAANGILMDFVKTGKTQTLESPYEVFQEARHTDGLPIAGDYKTYEQSWTLVSDGVLGPLWRFGTGGRAIVAVDLGDGLETALDTESMLEETAKSRSAGVNPQREQATSSK